MQLWDALAQTLGGGGLMARLILCLTHGEVPVPQGYDYAALVDKRAGALRRALRRRVGGGGAPCVVVEHLTRCERNKEGQAVRRPAACGGRPLVVAGAVHLPLSVGMGTCGGGPAQQEPPPTPPAHGAAAVQVLPNGDPWKVTLFRAIVDMALAHDAGAAVEYAAPNPSARRLWLIPVCLVAQLLLRHLVMERVIEWDATRGDRTGQYDKDTVACVPLWLRLAALRAARIRYISSSVRRAMRVRRRRRTRAGRQRGGVGLRAGTGGARCLRKRRCRRR